MPHWRGRGPLCVVLSFRKLLPNLASRHRSQTSPFTRWAARRASFRTPTTRASSIARARNRCGARSVTAGRLASAASRSSTTRKPSTTVRFSSIVAVSLTHTCRRLSGSINDSCAISRSTVYRNHDQDVTGKTPLVPADTAIYVRGAAAQLSTGAPSPSPSPPPSPASSNATSPPPPPTAAGASPATHSYILPVPGTDMGTPGGVARGGCAPRGGIHDHNKHRGWPQLHRVRGLRLPDCVARRGVGAAAVSGLDVRSTIFLFFM